jgi:hypothetical protein
MFKIIKSIIALTLVLSLGACQTVKQATAEDSDVSNHKDFYGRRPNAYR